MEKMKIIVYNDEGVHKNSLKHCIYTLNQYGYNVEIDTVDASFLTNTMWEPDIDLIVFPGGADTPYHRNLKGKGCQKIREFVENGGKYLGICAGGYFGARSIEFAKGTDISVIEERELAFFDGIAVGPILKNFKYNSEEGAYAANIKFFDNSEFFSYYNGGAAFIQHSSNKHTVIGTYQDKHNLPAIIECKVGKGRAILSGIHFEYSPELIVRLKHIPPDIKMKINTTKNILNKNIKNIFYRLGIIS